MVTSTETFQLINPGSIRVSENRVQDPVPDALGVAYMALAHRLPRDELLPRRITATQCPPGSGR
ncbi:hypothetical protein [Corynebacterium sp. CCM 9203]|uniref:hypothetical protein n=1 Tax=Corynebacterium sp. CCM 9203 TaxID=3057615 RepID=UPI003524589F